MVFDVSLAKRKGQGQGQALLELKKHKKQGFTTILGLKCC